ncbi:MAG: ABC transporter permease [Patescibacteria group bacterium]
MSAKFWQKIKEITNLSLSLAKANFKLRTEGSYLGILWYLLDPLLMFVVLFIIFSQNLGSQIAYFPIYLILGLIMFNFFSTATTNALGAITNNATFVKSIKINLESLVISLIIQTLYSHFFEIIIFAILLIFYGINPFYLLAYIPIIFFFSLMTLGLSFVLATIGVYTSDLNHIWRFLTQILFFATPIFYSIKKPNIIFILNPLVYYLKISRDLIIYHQRPTIGFCLIIITMSLIIFSIGLFVFQKAKNKFAENL